MKTGSDHIKEIAGDAKADKIHLVSSRLRSRDTCSPGQKLEVQCEHALQPESIFCQSLKLAMDRMMHVYDHALHEKWDPAKTDEMSEAIDHLAAAMGQAEALHDLLVQQGSTRHKRRGVKRKREEEK